MSATRCSPTRPQGLTARAGRTSSRSPPGRAQPGSRSRRKAMSLPCPAAPPGVSHTTGRAGGGRDRHDQVGVDLARPEVGVPVGPGAERVARVVGVHEVDAPGDGLDPVDDAGEVLPAGVRVAGVQAEADEVHVAALGQHVPQPADAVQGRGPSRCRHRRCSRSGSATAGSSARTSCASCRSRRRGSSSLRTWPPCTIRPLAPIDGRGRGLVGEDLAAGDADPVVRRGDVDQVGRVHVEVDARPPPRLPATRARPRRTRSSGPFQPCGSPRKNCARSAPRAAASAIGSTWSTWAPIRSPVERGVEDVTIRP